MTYDDTRPDPPPDPELSTEQRMLVDNLTAADLERIDQALLNNVTTRWQKMAKIIGITMQELPDRVPDIPDIFYAERLRGMVKTDEIEAEGHMYSMRYCELRSGGVVA